MLYSTPLPHTINGKLRDELLLNGEIFYTFKEAQITTGLILEMYIDRAMEERVQHCSAAQLARLQTACTRNYCFGLQRKNKKRRKENTDSIN